MTKTGWINKLYAEENTGGKKINIFPKWAQTSHLKEKWRHNFNERLFHDFRENVDIKSETIMH